MASYTGAEKENALRLCDEIGVAKASQETGIPRHTLYRWRSGVEGESAVPLVETDEIPAEAAVVEEKDASASQEGKSPRKRYSAEEKANALRLYDEVGVSKTSKQTGITINSLRKWHMDAQNAIVVIAAADEIPDEKTDIEQDESQTDNESACADVVARLVKTPVEESIVDENVSEELIRLRLENTTFQAQIVALKCALRAFTD